MEAEQADLIVGEHGTALLPAAAFEPEKTVGAVEKAVALPDGADGGWRDSEAC